MLLKSINQPLNNKYVSNDFCNEKMFFNRNIRIYQSVSTSKQIDRLPSPGRTEVESSEYSYQSLGSHSQKITGYHPWPIKEPRWEGFYPSAEVQSAYSIVPANKVEICVCVCMCVCMSVCVYEWECVSIWVFVCLFVSMAYQPL